MKSKKASIELSMNFIIGMIMGIVMLSLGLIFAFKIFNNTPPINPAIVSDTYIKNCVQNGKKVCIPEILKELNTRGHTTFGVVINNVHGDTRNFKIYVTFAKGILDDGSEISSVDLSKWTFADFEKVQLENYKYRVVDLPIIVPAGTKLGSYVFNVNVCFNANDNPQAAKCTSSSYPSLYDVTQQITVNVI